MENEKTAGISAALLYCMACALNGERASGTVLKETFGASPLTPNLSGAPPDSCGGAVPPDSSGAVLTPAQSDALLRLAKRHSVAALTYAALDGVAASDAWRATYNQALRRAILFDAERREILSFLDASGIWHMPLKGAVLQALYPRYGLREMSDNDILCDPNAWKTVRKFMLSRGYRQASPSGRGKEILYERPPAYRFEMHAALFDASSAFCAYYRDIARRLIPDPDTVCGRRFTNEDFYLYLLAHAAHDFRRSGTGFRTLADIFVFRRAKSAAMDQDYLRQELSVLGLTEFERRLEGLSRELFSHPSETVSRIRTLSPEDASLLAYLETSGVYGTRERTAKNLLQRLQTDGGTPTAAAKWRYCLTRLRIAAKKYENDKIRHPVALYPFRLALRLARDIARSRKRILRDLRILRETSDLDDGPPRL